MTATKRLQRYLARQLSHPTGIIGRIVLGPLWNRRNAELNKVTLAQLDLTGADRVLDIGFGGGYLLDRIIPEIARGFVAGLDASPVMVESFQARHRAAIRAGRVDVRCGQAESSPYPDGRFTRVSSVNSLFYWDDLVRGISEIYRVLEEEGKVVLTFTCKRDLDRKGFAQYGVKTYEEQDVRQMLAEAGFRDINVTRSQDRHREFICMTGLK
jgi:SAM-dependent methyltransferase